MFEKSAAQLVERLCGQYVEGVDQEHLKISMWKGDIFGRKGCTAVLSGPHEVSPESPKGSCECVSVC
eukprot:189507-Rhodomonas_salina.1